MIRPFLLFFSLLLLVACNPKTARIYDNFVKHSQQPEKAILPDFSYAGYAFGEKAITAPSMDIFDITDFGAVANDGKSDESAIKKAIAQAEKNGGGIVYFPAGKYLVNTNLQEQNDYILIQHSNVVLKGDGPEKTTIEIQKRAGATAITSGIYKFRFQKVSDHDPAFSHAHLKLKTDFITKISADIVGESFDVQVQNADNLKVGQWVTLYLPPTDDRQVKLFYTQPYDIPTKADEQKTNTRWYQAKMTLSERHLIKSIDGNTVTFESPVHIPAVAKHGWELRTFPHLENVGIEGIHIKGNWEGYYPGNHQLLIKKKAFSPLMMSACVNSFIKNCNISDYNMGMRLYNLAACSVVDLKMFGNGYNRGRHNVFLQNSNNVFVGKVQDFQQNEDAFTVTHSAIGNVFWHCESEPQTALDIHAAYPYANLYDNVKSSFKRKAGAGTNGPSGGYNPQHLGKLVLWNHHYTGKDVSVYPFWDKNDFYNAKHQFYVMPIVAGMHGNPISFKAEQCEALESTGTVVTPESLYAAQLEHRLGKVPAWLEELNQVKWLNESPVKADNKTIVTADFDHGSLDYMYEKSPNHFVGRTKHWLKEDSIGNQYYWFYYQMKNVKGKTITTVLEDMKGIYRGMPHVIFTDYTQPVFSYDIGHWDRITDVKYDAEKFEFKYTHTFTEDNVWIAYAHPYTYNRKEALIFSLFNNPLVQVDYIAKTKQKRHLQVVSITDPNVDDKGKKVIMVDAMQHAGEDCGGYLAEGLIKYLISDDARAAQIRKKFIFKVIPMMNPDGVFFGTTRYNMSMRDMNASWGEDHSQKVMDNELKEVQALQKYSQDIYSHGHIDMLLDVHSHSQQVQKHTILCPNENTLKDFAVHLNKYWKIKHVGVKSTGRMRAYYYKYGTPSGTIELSQSKLAGDNPYLTVEDYQKYGEGVARAVWDYYAEVEKTMK
ncbi:M14-type cytosolic carboxypeptidase [Persicobacter diffluens]|uniref:Peptidase M14 domain-containing protein n=1 Tax=Persicobacter diffluens TaxID=981 RepID=A0AAN4W378_9BACT|nr:hypothetical protein PEDI_48490 [Persicobacter diffluens]